MRLSRLNTEANGLWWRLVRFGFRLLYNELAFTYDVVSKVVSLGAWRCWQRAVLQYLDVSPDGCVLELAHGTGDLQIDLKTAGYRTVGYDLSPNMGRIAQKKLERAEFRPILVRGRAQQLPFRSAQFSAVVATFPTDFIFEPTTLQEIHRVLEDNKLLVIVPSGMFVSRGFITRFLEWLYRITGQRQETTDNGTMDQVVTMFEASGFEPQRFEEKCPRSVVTVIIARKRS